MSDFVWVSRARFAFRLALTGAAAGLLVGCASSERLSDPLSNPFQTSANVASEAPAAPAPEGARENAAAQSAVPGGPREHLRG